MLLKHIKKAFNRHPEAFHKYHIMASDIVSEIKNKQSVHSHCFL